MEREGGNAKRRRKTSVEGRCAEEEEEEDEEEDEDEDEDEEDAEERRGRGYTLAALPIGITPNDQVIAITEFRAHKECLQVSHL